MANYSWDFAVVARHADLLLAGGIGTLVLTASALAIAASRGRGVGFMGLSRWPVLARRAAGFIDLFRAAAALVLIVWFYYAFPILIGVSFDAYVAATLAIGLQAAASWAETYRAGIQSVGKGQWEAARAIGMPYMGIMRHIVIPQAFKRTIPVFFVRIIELLKVTALAAAITYGDLVYQAQDVASRTYRPVETFTVIALIYFIVIFGLSQLVRLLERRLAVFD